MSVNFKDFRTLNLHLFHLVSRSPWPCFMGIGLFLLLSGLVFFMHRINGGGLLLIIGMVCVISFSVGWFIDICEEVLKILKLKKKISFYNRKQNNVSSGKV
jgi:hypothetical protein